MVAVIDGKKIAEDVYARLPKKLLTLGILVGEKNPVIDSFVRIKEEAAEKLGIALVREELLLGATTPDAVEHVRSLAEKTDGIIVQLPLPEGIDVDRVLGAIPPEKDVDGVSLKPLVRPPVAGSLEEILRVYDVNMRGKNLVVVGSGRLVGKPCADFLRGKGALVTTVNRNESLDSLKDADIVVLGAGQPGLVKPEHIKEGVVLIDAGTSESSGKVVGDADPACAAKCSLFTPVPGGVGPVAVAMIFKNLTILNR